MIGIIGAMEIEVSDLRLLLENPKITRISGIEFAQGKLAGKDVVVARSGVGKVFAAVCAQTMILKFDVTKIINSGVAGSLTDSLHIGDIAISADVVQHDMDTSPVGDPKGLISGINKIKFEADPEMVKELNKICTVMELNHVTGTIASGDQFVDNLDRRREIVKEFGGIAAEMEAGAIAQVCFINDCPFVSIRVISDEADGNADINYSTFVRKAADISTSLTEALLTALK